MPLSNFTARAPSSRGQVKVMSVRLSASLETFCSTMSMLISASATARKMRAASPGASGIPTTVIFASERSWATPVSTASSTGISSIDPETRVPLSLLYEERTRRGTSKARAYSTERSMRTLAPTAAISNISSKLMLSSFFASLTMRGSAV